MPKSATSPMVTHIGLNVTSLATCWKLTRTDGVVMGFTDHDVDITYDGQLYKAASGFARSAVSTSNANFAVDNLDIDGVLDSSDITEDDLAAGVYADATIDVFLCNWADLSTTMGIIKLRKGNVGQITLKGATYVAEMRGLNQHLTQRIGELYSPTCRAQLGDARCTVDVEALRQSGTIGTVYDTSHFKTLGLVGKSGSFLSGVTPATITELTLTANVVTAVAVNNFSATDLINIHVPSNTAYDSDGPVEILTASPTGFTYALTHPDIAHATIAGTATPVGSAPYFNNGVLTFTSGPNNGKSMEVKNDAADHTLTLFLGFNHIVSPGDTFTIIPGCDGRLATCHQTYNNVINMRAEPHVPGLDSILLYPDAKG